MLITVAWGLVIHMHMVHSTLEVQMSHNQYRLLLIYDLDDESRNLM